jgi:IS5 family transposase
MRKRFEAQLTIGCTPIEEVKIPVKTRSHMAALIVAIHYIYVNPEWNERIFALLSEKITRGKKATGRSGMSLWEIFVLGQVRLCMNVSYDELHHLANYDTLLRGVMGVLPTDYSLGKQYEYQNIYDNVGL